MKLSVYLCNICKIICVILILLGLSPTPVNSTTIENVSYTVTVSASVGEPKLTLFGYSSPHSLVELKGIGVYGEVIANQDGYFFFDRIFLPPARRSLDEGGRPTFNYPELCLTAIDTKNRISFPACLPPLPVGPYEITVGPVLLPPTISLEKGNFLPTEQIAAEGETIPNTEVTIFLANDFLTKRSSRQILSAFWVSPAYAYSLPKYQIQVDENGHFEFNLPAAPPAGGAFWRVFAAATFLGSPTPKSNSLTFKVLSWWEWLWQKLKELLMLLLGLLKPYLWQLAILAEIVLICLLWRQKKSSKAHSDSLG